jgi:hypothetical protein
VDGRELNQFSNGWQNAIGISTGIRGTSRLWRALSIRQTDLLALYKHLHARVEALEQL